MKNFARSALLTLLLAVPLAAPAHEGHDHGVPGLLKPQRGGRILPALEGLLVELVVDKTTNTLKFYPTDKNYKALALKDVTLEVSAQRRRVDKAPLPLALAAHKDHYMASFDPQGRYPYNVDVKTLYKGQADTMQFIVDRN